MSGEPLGSAIRGLEIAAHSCPPGTEEGRGYLLISKLYSCVHCVLEGS